MKKMLVLMMAAAVLGAFVAGCSSSPEAAPADKPAAGGETKAGDTEGK